MTRFAIACAVAMLGLLPACSWLDAYSRPASEDPTPTHDTYLQGGPSTDIELGSGERTLLEDYKVLNDTKLQLEAKLAEAQARIDGLREQLGETEQERDRFRNHHAGSEQENERLSKRAQELEAKVLSLTIENTMLEQEILRHRIASLKQQYEDVVSSPVPGPTPMPGDSGR